MEERYKKVVDIKEIRSCWFKMKEMRRWLIKDSRDEKMVEWRLKRWEDGWLKIKEMSRWLIEDLRNEKMVD